MAPSKHEAGWENSTTSRVCLTILIWNNEPSSSTCQFFSQWHRKFTDDLEGKKVGTVPQVFRNFLFVALEVMSFSWSIPSSTTEVGKSARWCIPLVLKKKEEEEEETTLNNALVRSRPKSIRFHFRKIYVPRTSVFILFSPLHTNMFSFKNACLCLSSAH